MVKGAGLILVPRKMIGFVHKMLSLKEAKRLGWIPIIVGFLLCISAKFSYLALGIFFLGLLYIAKGTYLFVTPLDKLKKHKMLSLNEKLYRVMGIIVLIVGMVLINSAM